MTTLINSLIRDYLRILITYWCHNNARTLLLFSNNEDEYDDDEDGDDGNVDGDGTLGDVDRDQQRQRYSYDDIHDADDGNSDDAYYNSKNNVTNDWQTNKYNKDRLI